MRIALAHSSLASLGGGERFVLEAAREWEKRHEVSLYTWEYAPERTFPGFTDFDVKVIAHAKGFGALSKFFSWASLRPQADVVSAHGFPSHFASLRHPAVVYYLHIIPAFAGPHAHLLNVPYHSAIAPLDRAAGKRCASLAANSSFVADWAQRQYGRRPSVIHPGIRPSDYVTGKHGDFALCVARLSAEKRLLELVRQWTHKASGGLKLVVVGTGSEYFAAALRREAGGKDVEIISSGIPDRELRRLYSSCRCFVFPAHNEPFGMAVLEAMASGKPVVAHASGGPLELVNGESGFLFSSDAEMMGFVRKLAGNSAVAKRMGAKARKRAAGFAWEKQLSQLEKLLAAAARAPR